MTFEPSLWIEHHYVVVQSHGKAHPEDVWDEQQGGVPRDLPELEYGQQYHQPEQHYHYQSVIGRPQAEECTRPGDIEYELKGKYVDRRQTRNSEIPISVNRIIHTTGINPSGGANQGLTRVGYQVFTDMLVKTEPDEPTAWQMIIHKISFRISFFPIFFIASSIALLSTRFFCFDRRDRLLGNIRMEDIYR